MNPILAQILKAVIIAALAATLEAARKPHDQEKS